MADDRHQLWEIPHFTERISSNIIIFIKRKTTCTGRGEEEDEKRRGREERARERDRLPLNELPVAGCFVEICRYIESSGQEKS